MQDKIVKEEIEGMMSRGTTTMDLRHMLDNDRKIKILTYTDLMGYKDIESVLHPENRMILLYETSRGVGHWVCLFKDENHKNTLQMFDSYGFLPDSQLDFVPKEFKKDFYHNRKKLLQMLIKSNLNIRYNQHQLQAPNTATCGRWCVMRLRLSHLTEDEFYKTFTGKGVIPDFLVTVCSLF